jgi:hypothetical protein
MPNTKNQPKKSKPKNQKKGQQQKPKSPTVKTINRPKNPSPDNPDLTVDLCADCAYEVGHCEGKPKFSIDFDPSLTGEAADRVVQCEGFLHIDQIPPEAGSAGQPPAEPSQEPKTEDQEEAHRPKTGPRSCDVEHLRDYPDCLEECGKDKCDGVPIWSPEEMKGGDGDEDATDEEREEDIQVMKADAVQRAPLDRFEKDKTDYGQCATCNQDLKRTAYSRYVDAIRCTNPRCRNYRLIVRTVASGAK